VIVHPTLVRRRLVEHAGHFQSIGLKVPKSTVMSLISVELGTDGGVARDCHNASRSGSIFSRDYSFESRLIQRRASD
jgi:hypothetical protein